MNIYRIAPTQRRFPRKHRCTGKSCPTISLWMAMMVGGHGLQYDPRWIGGYTQTGDKSKEIMAHQHFLETTRESSPTELRKRFVSPSRISASSCGLSTHTSVGPSCTCGQSQGQEDRPGWGQSAGSRWRARPGTYHEATVSNRPERHSILILFEEFTNNYSQ